jgi:type IV fimbrial biogenesis protein FimT
MRTTITRGFTLIELLIAMSIFAFLIVIAGPQYGDFMGNMQIRNAAENTLTGLRLAQSEAVRGNTQAEFVLDTSAAGGWQVLRLNEDTNAFDPPAVQSYKWADGASRTLVDARRIEQSDVQWPRPDHGGESGRRVASDCPGRY